MSRTRRPSLGFRLLSAIVICGFLSLSCRSAQAAAASLPSVQATLNAGSEAKDTAPVEPRVLQKLDALFVQESPVQKGSVQKGSVQKGFARVEGMRAAGELELDAELEALRRWSHSAFEADELAELERRQSESGELEDFEGGQAIVISSGAVIAAAAIVLLILLLRR